MNERIELFQKKLKLSRSLHEIYPEITADTHEKFLEELLEKMYLERLEKQRLRNLKNAGFGVQKNLEHYRFDDIQFPERISSETLMDLKFMENKENLILYGSVGTGKTHLAIGLGVNAINQGRKAVFYRVHDLIQLLEESKGRKLGTLYKKIDDAELLILDEWGYLPLHQEGARLLFDIISRCYEYKSVIITTNIEFSKWKGFLFDEKLTAAIVDRLVHHSHMLLFTGESYRMRNSLMK
jgi:DNA replication protein DnaC